MSFQIRNNDKPVDLKDLDKEACELFGEQQDPEWWASPIKFKDPNNETLEEISRKQSSNWYDRIGYLIHQGADTWDKVKEKYLEPYVAIVKKYEGTPNYNVVKKAIMDEAPVKQLVDLIELWRSKGYIPTPIKD